MASADLIWQLVKKNNAFLVKRNGNSNASVQFSSEPNNLYNLNTFKYSGNFNAFKVLRQISLLVSLRRQVSISVVWLSDLKSCRFGK
jgi:hypothetical protein